MCRPASFSLTLSQFINAQLHTLCAPSCLRALVARSRFHQPAEDLEWIRVAGLRSRPSLINSNSQMTEILNLKAYLECPHTWSIISMSRSVSASPFARSHTLVESLPIKIAGE